MPVVTPTNQLKLLRGVRLSVDDRYTIYWTSKAAQQRYFSSKAVHSENNLTYLYVGENTLEIDGCSEDYTDVNYMMFQNSQFGDRWYYAYITSIEFDSPESAVVKFELDYWQTYFFDLQNNACMVLREHVSNDAIGAHIKAEPVDTGFPVISNLVYDDIMEQPALILASSFDPTSEGYDDVEGGVYGGIYSGVKLTSYSMYDSSKINDLNTVLKGAAANNKASGIVDLFVFPEAYFTTKNAPVSKEKSYPKYYGSFDGYTPHNNKLYVYPYNYMVLSTTNGVQKELRFELFGGNTCDFLFFGSPYNTPQIIAAPMNYNNTGATDKAVNLTESVVLEGFPHCCYNIDSFKAYIAQNGGSMAIGMLSNAFAIGAGAVGGVAGFGAVSAGISGMAGNVNNLLVQANKPPQTRGSASGGALAAYRRLDFMLYTLKCPREYAESIDEYFDVYGYEVDEVKVPNFTGRANVNYVKVAKSTLTGFIPSQYLTKMKSDLETGMWFWQNAENVGKFNLANGIV